MLPRIVYTKVSGNMEFVMWSLFALLAISYSVTGLTLPVYPNTPATETLSPSTPATLPPSTPATLPPSTPIKPSLPCNHPLRIVVPALFAHCTTMCAYSTWSSWEKLSGRSLTTKDRCPSGYYFTQQRTRSVIVAIGNKADCTEVKETQQICSPTNAERLIMSLNLGKSGNTISLPTVIEPINRKLIPTQPPTATEPTQPTVQNTGPIIGRKHRQWEEVYGDGTQCPHVPNFSGFVCPATGKRSADEHHEFPEEETTNIQTSDRNSVDIDEAIIPIPFDWSVHDSHFRRKRQSQCSDANKTQHILFVLDSSGSIGKQNFDDMKNAIATIVPLFCSQIKVALVSFSTKIKLEFCFNCYKDTLYGRWAAMEAINNIEYMSQLTYTGATAKCICDNILQESCGISTTPDCLDVIFITDGKSNDRNLEVCEEVKCLHSKTGVSTFALGIKGYDKDEIKCITKASDDSQIFEYETFQDFKRSIEELVGLISSGAATCVA